MGFRSPATEDFKHDLLSTIHPDTVPASPVLGDLIVGNSTPAWTRLPIGSSTQVLTIVGGVPTWAAAPANGNVTFFMTDAASADIAGYKALSLTLPPEAIATVGAVITGLAVAIEEWSTPITIQTPTFVPQGTWKTHFHAQRTAGGGQAQVYCGLYKRTYPGGVETLLGLMGPLNVSDNNLHEADIDLTLVDQIFLTSDRFVIKFYGNKVVGSGSDPTVTLSYRGDTGSRLEFPVSTSSLDHGLLSGLLDDDHTQYPLLAGRATGQTLYGGNAANDDLVLEPTAHATKTTAYVTLAVAGGLVGVGTATPAAKLAINGGLHVGGDTDPGDNNLMIDGNLGLNGQTPYVLGVAGNEYALTASRTFTDTTGSAIKRMFSFDHICQPASNVTQTHQAILGAVNLLGTAGNAGSQIGLVLANYNRSSGTLATQIGMQLTLGTYNGGSDSTGTVTSCYGIELVGLKTTSSTIGIMIGLYIHGLAGTAPWNLYCSDAASKTYIEGLVTIGSTTGAAKLSVNGGCHIGGTTDPGDNNLLVDGTLVATGGFGCNTKTAQTAYASGGALAAYSTGVFGLNSDANMTALYNLVVAMRAALVANGIMS